MNKIHRIVWNQAIGRWMVASELTRARGKRSAGRRALLAIAVGLSVGNAMAADACIMSDGSTGSVDERGTCIADAPAPRGIGVLGGLDGGVATGANAVAVGPDSQALGGRSVAVGNGAVANNLANVAIGDHAVTDGFNSVSMGYSATATGNFSLSLGGGSSATASRATAMGTDAQATGSNATATGNAALASGVAAAAFGDTARAQGERSLAMGANASVDAAAQYGVALGRNAQVTETGTNAVAIGQGAVASRANSVSVGTVGGERQIVNVRAATTDTDAVNFGQLKASAGSTAAALGGGASVDANGNVTAPSYNVGGSAHTNVGAALANLDGRTAANATALDTLASTVDGAVMYDGADKSSVRFGGADGTTLKNIADGDVADGSTDAVNGGQLHQTNQQVARNAADITMLDGRVTNVDNRVTTLVSDLDAGNVGLVRQDATTRTITVAGDHDGGTVSFAGTSGNRVLAGVDDGVSANDAVNLSQLQATEQGLRDDMGAIGDTLEGAVVYDGADKASVSFSGAQGTVLKNVAAGDVSDGSTEAVNGGQLHDTNERVVAAEGNISIIQGDVTRLDSRVTTNEGDITHLTSQVSQLAAGGLGLVTHDASTGVVSVAAMQNGGVVDVSGTDGNRVVKGVAEGRVADDSDEAVNGAQLKATNDRVAVAEGDISNLDGRVTINEGNLTQLSQDVNNLSNGSAGIVQYDATSDSIKVGSQQDGSLVDMAGTSGARRIGGVANGVDDADVATIAQLKASGLVDPNDGRALGALVYDDVSLDRATLGGSQGTVIANLGNGLIAAGSREAINGGQLWQVQADWEARWTALDGRVGVVEERIADGNIGGPGNPGGPGTSPGTGQGSVAIGDGSHAAGSGSIGIGNGAGATGEGAVAIGDGASASGNRSVAIGAGSVADRDQEVSVGSQGNERVISNVANGTRATDAVNVGQMEDRFQAERDWSNSRFQAIDKRFDRMGAISAAYAGMALNTAGLNGDNRVGAGVGAQNGRTALAVGYQRIVGEKKNMSVSLGGAFSGSDQSVSAGAGFSW